MAAFVVLKLSSMLLAKAATLATIPSNSSGAEAATKAVNQRA